MEYIIAIVVIVLIFGTRAFKEVKDFLLKKEQIKADALVRSEALRLKNQYELEKLIQNEQTEPVSRKSEAQADTDYEKRSTGKKQRS